MASSKLHGSGRRFGAVVFIACTISAGAGCSGGDAEPTPEAAAEILAADMDPSVATDGGDEPPTESDGDRSFAFIDDVARCMQSEGFDFVAALPEQDSDEEPAPEGEGYGIVASVLAPTPDPNEEILDQMDPLDQEAYLVALWGDPVAGTTGCAGEAMDSLDVDPDGDTESAESFVDRDVEELRARTVALASARPEVLDAIGGAVVCANDRLGGNAIDDSFDFLSIAEYRVARIVDEEQADAGATLFDLVASADGGQLELDDSVVEEMLAAEAEVRQVDMDCRGAIQPVLRQAFVDVAAELLASDPETTAAIVEGDS